MATKKVKKFGRGGDILTGLGAALAGYGLYQKFSKSKDEKDSQANLKTIAEPSKSSKESSVQDTDERFKGKSKEPAEPEQSRVYKAEPGVGTAKSVTPVQATPAAQKTKVTPGRYEGQTFPATAPASTKDSTSGTGPKNTFLTKERSDQANKAVGQAWRDQNPGLAKSQAEKLKDYQANNAKYQQMLDSVQGKKKGGKVKKYGDGGAATTKPEAPKPEPKKDNMPEWAKNERENAERDRRVKKEGAGAEKEVKKNMSTFGFKKGGTASSRADGCAIRGKTRGKVY